MERMANCRMTVVQFTVWIPCAYNLQFTPMHFSYPFPSAPLFISHLTEMSTFLCDMVSFKMLNEALDI